MSDHLPACHQVDRLGQRRRAGIDLPKAGKSAHDARQFTRQLASQRADTGDVVGQRCPLQPPGDPAEIPGTNRLRQPLESMRQAHGRRPFVGGARQVEFSLKLAQWSSRNFFSRRW